MPEQNIPEDKMTLELSVPIELGNRWTGRNTDELSGHLQRRGFGPEGANLRFVKAHGAKVITVYVRGSGRPEEFQDAVLTAIDDLLSKRTGFWIKTREVRIDEL